jgi:hypothetical protein
VVSHLVEIRISGPAELVADSVERVRRVLPVVRRSTPRRNRADSGVRVYLYALAPSEIGTRLIVGAAAASADAVDLREVRAIVTDKQALSRISLPALTSYLESHGWVEVETPALTRQRRWLLRSGRKGHFLAVPGSVVYADFAIRMGEIVDQLAVLEGRSQLAVLAELLKLASVAGAEVARG